MLARHASLSVAAILAFAITNTGCVLAPAADVMASPPSIEEIVARVKCDLYEAVAPQLEDRNKTWFQTWAAQANLNLIVSDQGNITPSVTFIQPLTTESIPLRVTNMARSWNFGVSAGVNTTATRNESLTFSMSLREIYDALQAGQVPFGCDKVNTWDLHSELGMKEWISDALWPADDRYLVSGHHKSSKAAAAPKSGAGGAALTSLTTFKNRPPNWPSPYCTKESKRLLDALQKDLAAIKGYAIPDPTKADTPAASSPPPLVITYVDKHLGRIVDKALNEVRVLIAEARFRKDNPCVQWAKSLEDTLLQLELDPPIDAISAQIQFIIAYNASASPSWTLLHFKGPAPTSSLVSGTKTLTHTLSIAIGPPSSPDATNQLNALVTSAAITNSLQTTGIKISPF
jgi:hypothetical protein